MKRLKFLLMAAVLGVASTASGLSISVASDKTTYTVGETILLTISADPTGGDPAFAALTAITYEAALTEIGGAPPTQDTIPGGLGASGLTQIDGASDTLNQVLGLFGPLDPTGLPVIVSTVTLIAEAPGTVNVGYSGSTLGDTLEFFGAGPGDLVAHTFNIVPEPGTLLLLGAGLTGLALVGRRREV